MSDRRGVDLVGIERGVQHLGALREQLQLRRLVFRNEAVERHHAQHLRHLLQLRLDLPCLLFRRGHHVDGIGAGVGILAQIEEGRDRLRLRVAQVHRVEVELHEIEQRQAGDREKHRATDDQHAVLLQEVIERRQEGVADRLLLAGRVQQLQHRRQHGDAGEERDQHADAGDLAKFGDTLVVGGDEAEEAGRGRHGRQRQRNCRALGSQHQRTREIVVLVALGAIADAVLNAEIDAEADEQHGERDRQQIERAHHHQAGGGRQRKTDEEIDEHREDDLRRMQRQPQDEQHDEDGADAVDDGAFLDGCIFLVGDRDRSGQPDPRLIFGGEIQFRCGLADRVGRALAGLQRVVVEDWLELDEGALVRIRQRLVTDELAPGECRIALVEHGLDRLRDLVEWPFGVVELDLAALDAGKSRFQRAGQAADRGIARHDLDQGRGGFELAGDLADFLCRQEQQAILLEELAGAELLHRLEVGLVVLQLGIERVRRRGRHLRRLGFDHRRNRGIAVEGAIELLVALAPVQILSNQRIDVGVDGKVLGRVIARPHRQQEPESDDEGGKPGAGPDDGNDYALQHYFSFCG